MKRRVFSKTTSFHTLKKKKGKTERCRFERHCSSSSFPPRTCNRRRKPFSKASRLSLFAPTTTERTDQPGVIEGALRKAYLLHFFSINRETEGERRGLDFLKKDRRQERERRRESTHERERREYWNQTENKKRKKKENRNKEKGGERERVNRTLGNSSSTAARSHRPRVTPPQRHQRPPPPRQVRSLSPAFPLFFFQFHLLHVACKRRAGEEN